MKLCVPFVLALLASSASAAGTVLAFDGTRCYSGANQYWLTGNGMAAPFAQLIAHGWTVQTTSLITPAALQGVSIFVTGTMFPSTLDASEVSALQTWVAAGGGLLYCGDGDFIAAQNVQFAALVNGPQYSGQFNQSGVTDTIVAPTHPLIQGPGGTVAMLSGFNGPGRWTGLSPTCTDIAENPDTSSALVAVTYGAGRALLTNDANYFAYPPVYMTDNAILWDNTIAWLGGGPPTTVTSFCSGDGTASACPCGNVGAAGTGCANSFGVGALLAGSGVAHISGDSFVLGGTQMPNAAALYFQGNMRLNSGMGVVFGDGLRCAGGSTKRLGTKVNSGGASSYPGGGDVPISVRGACTAGATRTYQVWYRNAASFCTPSTFNLSNGVEITWDP